MELAKAWLLSVGHNTGLFTSYQNLNDNTTKIAWQEGKQPRWRIAYIIAGVCTFALLPLAYAVLFMKGKPAEHVLPINVPYTTIHWGPHWRGWHNVDHMVVLGDSYSSTGFDLEGDLPSASNPLGNPKFPGATVTNGENWVDYLIYSYNKSVIMTADLAVGGATIDSDLIHPGVPLSSLRSLKTQIGEFQDQFAKSSSFPWTANSSLFSVWVGVNDLTAYTNETRKNFPVEFNEFGDLMMEMYDLGARNFLLFNAPPLDKSPMAPFSDPIGEWPMMIDQWNLNFTQVVNNFIWEHNETTVFLFDVHKLFDEVIEDPCLFPESCGFKVTTDCCDKYMFGSITPDFKDPSCEYSIDKYFWVNRLHPSTQTHNMTAHVVARALMTGGDTFG